MGRSQMSNSDWWAKQLGVKAQPQQSNPMPPSQQPMTPYVAPQPQPQVTATKAQSANQTALCPNCSGTNYMSVQGTKPRCYDCGYPVEQSASQIGRGIVNPTKGSTPVPTKQVAQTGFHPDQIVGKA